MPRSPLSSIEFSLTMLPTAATATPARALPITEFWETVLLSEKLRIRMPSSEPSLTVFPSIVFPTAPPMTSTLASALFAIRFPPMGMSATPTTVCSAPFASWTPTSFGSGVARSAATPIELPLTAFRAVPGAPPPSTMTPA